MKNKKRFNLSTSVIAGILVMCMLVLSVSVIGRLSKFDFDYTDKEHKAVVTTKQELEQVLADGKYDGTDSDLENKDDGWIEIAGQGLKYGKFNILEVVPDRRYGYVGYMQEGCEPISEDITKRKYIMDAMVNNAPGSNDAYQEQFWFNAQFGGINLGDGSRIITREIGTYDGYYLKVEPGEGVYGLCTASNGVTYDSDNYVENVIMQSKFAVSANYSHSGYDFVWVELENGIADTDKTSKNQMDNLKVGDKIFVRNHKKCKYLNCNLIEKLMYNTDDVRVFTRTASELEAEPDLVRNVDMIYVLGDVENACTSAFSTYTHMYGGGATAGKFSQDNDIPTDQMLKIYDRVVNQQNLAIVYSHVLWGVGMDLNIQKLMFMLYMVENKDDYDDKSITGSGREFFNGFLKSKESPVFARVRYNPDDAEGDLRVSDIVYIDETNANLIVNGDYSGQYFRVDTEDIRRSDAKWEYNNYAKTYSNWPISFEDNWLLKWANGNGSFWTKVESWMRKEDGSLQDWVQHEGGIYVVDGVDYIYQSNVYNNNSFPLYKYYTEKYKFETDPGMGRYKNQYIHNDTGRTFRYGSDGELGDIAEAFKEIIPNKIMDPEQITTDGSQTRTVYMTMNIKNGNSVNLNAHGNKNIYINDYEFENGTIKDNFELDFEMKSTHPVERIIVTVKDKDYVFNYNGSTPLDNTQTGDPTNMDKYLSYVCATGGTLTITYGGTDEEIKNDYNVTSDVYKYNVVVKGLDSDDYNNINTPVKIKAETGFIIEKASGGNPTKYLTCEDNIMIVKNTFFELD